MPFGFTHLHTHSEFSLLDGAARLDGLVKRAIDLEMGALALTDHGVMYGALDFYVKCREAGIKPIIGVEAYVAPGNHKERTRGEEKNAYHLLLLASNLKGYKNLLKLTTFAAIDGFYYKPRVDHSLLQEYHEGIIATSACLSGEVCSALVKGDYAKARDVAGFYRDLFGRENYYIELQDHSIPRQRDCNEQLVKIAQELGLQTICTNDVHYLDQKDADAHDVLLCIGTGSTVSDPNRMRYDADQFYMKSAGEMANFFPQQAGALEQTAEIAERCNLVLEFGNAPLPAPEVPDGLTPSSYLRLLAEEGLQRKAAGNSEVYRQRLDYELGIVQQTGFEPYFLIVRDFALFARQKGIIFGVRGSAAGSLASFCLDITDIDPIAYDLTFERFLNPERIQMPDIDMDFEDARRGEVIDYVTRKYGEDHVAQIITFGTLAARAALKDSGRALGMPIPDVNRIVGMIPTLPLGITIKKALDANPEFKQAYTREPDVRKLVDTAQRLEGISRHASVHAAGVVISHEPLVEYTPLQRSNEGTQGSARIGGFVTQYPAGALEQIGLLKMDFLGLINLSILGRAVEAIRISRGIEIDVQNIPLDDSKTFELLASGETTGVFQLESAGMRRYVQELKPASVRELAAMIALYRPGPMAHIPTYIRAKHGLDKIAYRHPALQEVLEETYGVIVYQDQVMRIAQVIAGYTLGSADILRRAMGKKKKEEMARQRADFLAGAAERGIPAKKATEIFDLIEPFAGYAFNKAHAVCYAMVAYQTAYLKANYPVEYMAALLACYTGKTDKIASCMEECARLKITVLPPDVNLSGADFSAEYSGDMGAIRFGLWSVKNVGRAAVDVILAARRSGGPFSSLAEFCLRSAEIGGLTRATIEALVQCGAFGSIHSNRRALATAIDAACQIAARAQRDREMGQSALFGAEASASTQHDFPLPDVKEFEVDEILVFEKDLLGIYVSDHPLRKVQASLQMHVTTTVSALCERPDREEVTIGGIISTIKPFISKKSREPMAFLTIEDLTGTVPVTVFPSIYRDCQKAIVKDRIVVLRGRISRREKVRDDDDETTANVELLAEEIKLLPRNGSNGGNGRSFFIRLDSRLRNHVGILRRTLEQYPGDVPVNLQIHEGPAVHCRRTNLLVNPENALAAVIEITGKQAVWME